MKRHYLLTVMLFSLAACQTPSQDPIGKPTITPLPSATPINISIREQKITTKQSPGNYKTIPLSLAAGTDLYLTLTAAERTVKSNDEIRLKFVSTLKDTATGTETWAFKAGANTGEFDLSFQIRQSSGALDETAEIFKITIR